MTGIYTGKGDAGFTENLNGQSISKNDALIHFIGALDELNCHLGLLKAMLSNDDAWQHSWQSACSFIEKIQINMMKLMSHLSDINNNKYFFTGDDVDELEKEIDKLSVNIPKNNAFILPGKNIIEANIQIARAVARRAERHFFAVNKDLCQNAAKYLNRLSDYLFILSQQDFDS